MPLQSEANLHYLPGNTYFNQSCDVTDIGSHISHGFVIWRTHWCLGSEKTPQPVKCWFFYHPLGRLKSWTPVIPKEGQTRMAAPSTPSLPIIGQNCWAPANFQFFVGIALRCLKLEHTCDPTLSLSGVFGWLPFLLLGWKYKDMSLSEFLSIQKRTGKSLQHPERSDCWATTLGGQAWHTNNRMGSHPNNN